MLGDEFSLARDLVHRPKGASHQHVTPAGRDKDDDGQADSQQNGQAVQQRVHRLRRCADFDEIAGAWHGGAKCRDQQRAAFGQDRLARELAAGSRFGRGDFFRIETLVVGRTRHIKDAAIAPADADEAVAAFGSVKALDCAPGRVFPGPGNSGDKSLPDLAGPPRLGFKQRGLQVALQLDEQQRAQEDEDRREDPGMPGRQAKSERAGIHDAGSLERR